MVRALLCFPRCKAGPAIPLLRRVFLHRTTLQNRLQAVRTEAAFPSHSTEHRMKKIVVIGATGTLGQAVSAELRARHEVIEVGATRGQYRADITDPASVERLFAEIGKVDG